MLAIAMLAAREKKFGMIMPAQNAAEAAVVDLPDVIPVDYLTEAVGFLTEALPLTFQSGGRECPIRIG